MDPHPTQQPDERNLTHRIAYQHLNDPNYVIDEHVLWCGLWLTGPSDFEDDSPYPEVRAAVANTDDPTMPTNTFRISSACDANPSVQITALVAQLVALPAGKLLEKTLPRAHITTFGYTWSLNPGPFNIKEHTLITVMANVVAGGAYATDIIAAQRLFYQQYWGATYQLALVVSTQMFGFSLAGICRRFLVWPSSMIWPATLVNTALFNTLHSTYGREEDGRTSRERFFTLAFIGSAAWYFLPGYLFVRSNYCFPFLPRLHRYLSTPIPARIPSIPSQQTLPPFHFDHAPRSNFNRPRQTALSNFTWVCWIAPDNLIVNALFGYQHGLGMGFITFDWAMVAYNSSPLVTPFWAELNVFGALVIVYWIIAPILYYKNVFFSKYLPISSLGAFDRWGDPYKASYVIKDGEFDVEALWYRHDIVRQFRSSMKDETDVHSRLMLAYPEVPQWWYIVLGLISFALGIVTIEVWDTKLPVWAFILSLLISLVYLVPVGMIQAITNQQVGLNVITELIVGYMLPGKPVAMMIFKTFGYITMTQALAFVSDLKLGHYMKVPPRLMYLSQVIASLVSCFVVVGVQAWMFEHIPNLCDINQPSEWFDLGGGEER
ncbi:unnamed protein product [Rhizoctonia solani]|uniref:Uncharacterized protein n=1 Tax=Rhizoctonia solani TaxID=456999 RepID=A0A8H3GM18_9AGAM|nr:unnamed protein product [Rhizoctonia solani]